jgi:heme-degrading monooxygenase HmoA
MTELIARVEVKDFETWLRVHRANATKRAEYGMTDGPIYRDVDNPNALLVHTHVDDLDRAQEWFNSEAFKAANRQSTAEGREFYVAERHQPGQ